MNATKYLGKVEAFWSEHISHSSLGQTFTCDKCKTSHRLHLGNAIQIFVCANCGKVFSAYKKSYEKTKNTNIGEHPMLLPLGAQAIFGEVLYTVVGYAQKKERNKNYVRWEEYVLHGDDKSIVFLNQINGHWIYITECKGPDNFKRSNTTIEFEDREYSHYHSYGYVCTHIRGEFPYDVVNLSNLKIHEYVSAPYFFSAEYNQGTPTFFRGHYLRPRQVRKAFQTPIAKLPSREGFGACQPFMFGINTFRFNILTVLLILLTLPFVYSFDSEESVQNPVTHLSSSFNDSNLVQKLNSETFIIENDASLLRFDSYCNVSNDWAEAEINLINETTGKEQNFFTGVEYYYGADSDGQWAEGSSGKIDYIGGLDKGRYHLEVIFSGASALKKANYELAAYMESPLIRNYWVCVSIFLSIAILFHICNYYFERLKLEE